MKSFIIKKFSNCCNPNTENGKTKSEETRNEDRLVETKTTIETVIEIETNFEIEIITTEIETEMSGIEMTGIETGITTETEIEIGIIETETEIATTEIGTETTDIETMTETTDIATEIETEIETEAETTIETTTETVETGAAVQGGTHPHTIEAATTTEIATGVPEGIRLITAEN